MSGINRLINSNNQKAKASGSALGEALESASVDVMDPTEIKNKAGDQRKYTKSENI